MTTGLAEGTLLGGSGRYRLLRPIGEDGFGSVWSAEDTSWHRRVTLRVISESLASNDWFMGRFAYITEQLLHPVLTEGTLRLPLSHTSAARILGFDLGNSRSPPIVVMEPIDGWPLAVVLQQQGKLDVSSAVRIALDVAGAVQGGSNVGIVHGCLNPDNLIIGSSGTVKVIDFGLAAAWVSPPGVAVGQSQVSAFVAPEVLHGATPSPRSDAFSVGAILYAMLTGRPPVYDAREIERISLMPPDVPEAITLVCLLALARNPRVRLASPGVFASKLSAADLVSRGTSEARPNGETSPAPGGSPKSLPGELGNGRTFVPHRQSGRDVLVPLEPKSGEVTLRSMVPDREGEHRDKRSGPTRG